MQAVKIHSDEIKLIVPVNHPLASRPSATCHDLVPYSLLLPKYGTTRTRLNEWLELVEDKIQGSMELDSTEMIKRFVLAGLGLSFLAASNCAEEVVRAAWRRSLWRPRPWCGMWGSSIGKTRRCRKRRWVSSG